MITSTTEPEATSGGAGSVAADELAVRARAAQSLLRDCRMCEHRCGFDRIAGYSPVCGLGAHSHVLKTYVSCAEERELIPTLRVYFNGCNFGCRFCNVPDKNADARMQWPTDPRHLAEVLSQAVRGGVKTINLLGGEPSLHTHNILQLAAAAGSPLPLVLNTNGYMTPTVIDLLRGVISVHLVDFKFGNDRCARLLAGVPCYVEVVTRNLMLLSRDLLIVRHLLMPGHLDCCFRPVATWLDQHLPGVRFQLMTGYVPDMGAVDDPTLGRLNTRDAIREAVGFLNKLNLDWDSDGRA